MKKIIMTFVAMFSMTFAMAQTDSNTEATRQDRSNRPDPKEMIQKRTQEMVKTYGLNDEQATKLQALNEKYMMMGGPRGPRPDGMKKGERPEPPRDGDGKHGDMQKGDSIMAKGQHRGGSRMSREEMEKQMKAYDEGIKAIFTADQYKAFQAEQEKRAAERKERK